MSLWCVVIHLRHGATLTSTSLPLWDTTASGQYMSVWVGVWYSVIVSTIPSNGILAVISVTRQFSREDHQTEVRRRAVGHRSGEDIDEAEEETLQQKQQGKTDQPSRDQLTCMAQ